MSDASPGSAVRQPRALGMQGKSGFRPFQLAWRRKRVGPSLGHEPQIKTGALALALVSLCLVPFSGPLPAAAQSVPTSTPTPPASPTAPVPTSTPAVGAPATGLRIRDVQGAGHLSPYSGTPVAGVPGIVTSRRSNGFTFQDASPDDDAATAEGIFVFTATAEAVAIGDEVRVDGVAQEFRPACPPAS